MLWMGFVTHGLLKGAFTATHLLHNLWHLVKTHNIQYMYKMYIFFYTTTKSSMLVFQWRAVT